MEIITVNELKKLCDFEIVKGNGNKKILISQDDEGNGYHYLFFAFTPVEEVQSCIYDEKITDKDYIVLG